MSELAQRLAKHAEPPITNVGARLAAEVQAVLDKAKAAAQP